MTGDLDKFRLRSRSRFLFCALFGIFLTHSLLMFFDELDRCFDNDVVEKTFYNVPGAILRVDVKIRVCSGEGAQRVVDEVTTDQANLAD